MASLFARFARRFLMLVVLAAALLALPASVAADAKDAQGNGPAAVTTASDAAMDKLHPKLEEQVESGSTETISVFVTVEGNSAAATAALDDAKVAESGGVALVVGEISVQALPKLAGKKGVVSVGPIELEQTGQPLGSPDPELKKPFDKQKVNEALEGLYKREVPYSKAPPLKGSNFEELKKLAVLDAKTHDFADAWHAGFTGTGVTVGVLDGGTDFGHPDLIGTWQVWSDAHRTAGWNGWPKAFDPYGTLQLLAAPSDITDGLSLVHADAVDGVHDCPDTARSRRARVALRHADRAVAELRRTGRHGRAHLHVPAPAGRSRAPCGSAAIPDDYLLGPLRRAAGLPRHRPEHGRNVYDTVYVDLDDDYDFSDEKPVTKASPVSYRDMNGDGYTDLSGGLVYYISDGGTSVPGRPARLRRHPRQRVRAGRADRLVRRLRPGDRGPRHADGLEHRRPGRDQRRARRRFTDVPGRHVSRRGHRRCAAREARSLRRHLLLVRLLDAARLLPGDAERRGHHVELLRLVGRSTTTGTTRPARKPTSSTTTARRPACSRRATARRASARPRRRRRPRASRSARRRSSAAPAGTRSTGSARSSTTT